MGFERFEHNPAGYRAILKSGPVQGILEAKARRIEAAVVSDIGFLPDWEIITDVRVGRTRARAMVSGVPLRVEQRNGTLGRAVDAGRG